MANKVYVGIDIAQAKFDAAIWQGSTGTTLNSFSNGSVGFEQLQATLPVSEAQIVLVLEPTGGYELALVAFAYSHAWQVCLPNPKQVRDFAKSCGRRAKTDAQDALLLAQFGAEQLPEPQQELPPQIQELAELPRRWVVERTFAWFSHHRRLSKDYEGQESSSEAMIYIAMTRLMLRRLAPG